MDAALLGRISQQSGGSYFDLSEMEGLTESVEFTPNAYSKEVQIDLWDKPWLLAFLISLLCIDWASRRLKGLS